MVTRSPDLDDLIDARQVAEILGLAHRNSVSTYRARYADFPPGQPAPGGGRSRLWTRREVLDWQQTFRSRQAAEGNQPSERREALVEATTRLMLASPNREISIREIAAEAGVAHSDLYRHAESKDELMDLAFQRVEDSIRGRIPADPDEFLDKLPAIIGAVRERRAALLVLLSRVTEGTESPPQQPVPANDVATLLQDYRATHGRTSTIDARVGAAAVTAMIFGLVALEPRWLHAFDLEEIPVDQVVTAVRALFDA